MSYLTPPRLTFAGQFQADPSTVNNDPTHFNNATFQPSYQEYSTDKNHPNGWWNPDGTGSWRFIGCTVTSVTYKDGTTTADPADDPIIGMSIMDSGSRVAGKIVDLDSQQQAVSMLWGLIVRIVASGSDVVKGEYEPAAFTNLWGSRSTDLPGFGGAGAMYQSVIKNITWDIEKLNSRYLKELNEISPDQLSIKFNVDRYSGNHKSPQFTLGRIVGSIGPSSAAEPNHFVPGRQLFPADYKGNYAVAVVDENLRRLTADLGNSFQFTTGGKIAETRRLALAVDKGSAGNPDYVYLGEIDYSDPQWYLRDAGICKFHLSEENLAFVNQFPLVILDYQANQTDTFTLDAQTTAAFQESAEYVCADQFVFRLNPGESCQVTFYATNLGKPLAGKTVDFQLDTLNTLGQQPPGTPSIGGPVLPVLNPAASANTEADGKAVLTITGTDPGNPRVYIDGQVYGISYNLSDQQFQNCNQANFISLLVFDAVAEATVNNPTWADLQPVMQQYANLYPIMSKGIFNLANQTVVDDNAEILKFVFDKEKNDPNYMPATRDLSRDKQRMILNYLDNVLAAEAPKETVTIRKA